MAKIQISCNYCNKPQAESEHRWFGRQRHVTLACGHTMIEEGLSISDDLTDFISDNGKKPYPYQMDGVRFAETSNGRCLFADEMGLGKTIQMLITMAKHEREVLPVVAIVKAGLIHQWYVEFLDFLPDHVPYICKDPKEVHKGFKIYLMSYEMAEKMFPRFVGGEDNETAIIPYKTVILDEVQHIKNGAAKRTNAVRDFCRRAKYILAASGTPIKNNAAEYFPILNILRPEIFRSQGGFIKTYCDSVWTGYGYKVGGLSDYGERLFRERTKEFIIRRTRDEVLPDLPKIRRNPRFADMSGDILKAYNQQFKLFEDAYEDESVGAFEKSTNILQYMSKMRHLAGLAKVDATVEFAEDFLHSTDRKLVLFVHHQDVAFLLSKKLTNPLMLGADAQGDARANLIREFKDNPNRRLVVASTLSAGEGLNLQFCSDAVLVERQWNPANEEQVEGRFSRIGSTASHIDMTYMVAVGTIDEWFAELVEKKRAIMNQTLDGKSYTWDESSIMKELADTLYRKGQKGWKL